jgi:hypothetical protein
MRVRFTSESKSRDLHNLCSTMAKSQACLSLRALTDVYFRLLLLHENQEPMISITSMCIWLFSYNRNSFLAS